MRAHPFTPELKDGVLQLWLETPRCEVNIFSTDAAEQLQTLLKELDQQVEAVVLRSAKRGSFVNGAQLMLANTAQKTEDVARLTAPVRNAYRALRALRVPTIAAVQGSCFGCGVEFVLHANYRVAERALDTQFYLTEIADYLLVPTFGATQDLPGLVGLDNASRLLLWGERWSADRALECGLVDAAFEQTDFETRLADFVATVVQGRRPARPERAGDVPALVAQTLARIEELPPDYRALYSRCFELLVAATVRGADYEREAQACARSVTRPMAKAAIPFFFVREFAKAKCGRGAPERAQVDVSLRGLPGLRRHIELSRPRDVALLDSPSTNAGVLRLVAYDDGASDRHADEIAVALAPALTSVAWTKDLVAYAPLYSHGIHFFEIAERVPSKRSAELFDLLSRLGFGAVSTVPRVRFALDELLEAYFAPLSAFVRGGGTREVAATTLRDFGFVRGPGLLAEWLGPRFAPELAGAQAVGGVRQRALLDAVLLSLLDFVLVSRQSGSVTHPSLIDLMARELLDFPLAHTSLCRHLTRNRVAQILHGSDELALWVEADAIERAREYARGTKDFYA